MYQNIREEELKNRLRNDYFKQFDCTQQIGNIDFSVASNGTYHLWAESKKGRSDTHKSLTQLILTIGKAKQHSKTLPPAFLGAFDAEKIIFVPYSDVMDIFYINDFDWTVTPSNHDTKEFKTILKKVTLAAQKNSSEFQYNDDLKRFIKTGFITNTTSKITIDKNNFVVIYGKWLDKVKPSIAIDWSIAKTKNIIDGDFFLADILSSDNKSIKDNLYVLLQKDKYQFAREFDDAGIFNSKTVEFNDRQKAHRQFWNTYDRPPTEDYWDYFVRRRDLLVPQDVRERKGSFFTPKQWVELSQKYLTDYFGDDWQEEYYIWDCAAGTGNLLNGLTNKYNIWASTLDQADVDVMYDRIENGANLLEKHVFKFDFLNDDFEKLPPGLRDIINDKEKRKKLIIYINPPYAEAAGKRAIAGTGEHKSGVAKSTKIHKDFTNIVGAGASEIFTQFYLRVSRDLPKSKLAAFSKLKYITSPVLFKFREYFKADFKGGFICDASSFDNVTGKFPIGFVMWDMDSENRIEQINVDIPERNTTKTINSIGSKKEIISNWLQQYYDKQNNDIVGWLALNQCQMQANRNVFITSNKPSRPTPITMNNIIEMGVYLTARHCVELTWINSNDQVLYPTDDVNTDIEFQNNCFTYSLFTDYNNIKSEHGTNHWIPFTEQDVGASDKFASHFMTDFIRGKCPQTNGNLCDTAHRTTPLEFSTEAEAVFNTGRALWRYYHKQDGTQNDAQNHVNVNASYYDIRAHFQGRNKAGRMNPNSENAEYTKLLGDLKSAMKTVTNKIVPKVYEYGFLLK